MAKRTYYVDLDLNYNQLVNTRFENRATAPVTTTWGGINVGYNYFDTTTKKLIVWDGTDWLDSFYVHPNHTGDVDSVGDGAITIKNGIVSNAKLATMATMTIKGNNTGVTGAPIDLTKAQVLALLNVQDGAQANIPANLALGTVTSTTQPITNSNGTGFTLSSAIATTAAGLMSGPDKAKLDGIQAGAQVNVATNLGYTVSPTNGIITNSNGTTATIPLADTTNAGLLAPGDKTKINTAVLFTTTDVSTASWVINETNLVSNSTTKVPTQASVKSYVDNLVLSYGALVFQGSYNAATNTPLLDATPVAGIKKGWTYVVTVAGDFFSASDPLEVGDLVIAIQDSPTTIAHWTLVNKNIPEVLSTLLAGYSVGGNVALGVGDSILVAFGKIQGQLNARAPIASPSFTGTPLSITPVAGDNSTQIATTAFVNTTVQTTSNGMLTKSVAGGTNVTLTATEANNGIYKFTGLLTANISVIVPNSSATYVVINGTTGAFTLTVKTSAGTGILVAQGLQQKLVTDGTNVIQATNDFQNTNLTGIPVAPTAAPGTNTTQLATTAFVVAADTLKANLASPTFTGIPAGPTATVDTNTTQFATTAFVLGQGYAKLLSPTFTGTPLAPTAAVDTNTTQLATTAFVIGQGYLKSSTASTTYAPLASPVLTGVPTAPTAAVNTNTTQIATTAFVLAQGYSTTTGTVRKVNPAAFGNGVATTFVIAHSFGADVIAQVRTVADNIVVECQMTINAADVTLDFNVPPATGSMKVVILG